MSSLVVDEPVQGWALPETRAVSRETRVPRGGVQQRRAPTVEPNALVRWAFYLSVLSVPFTRLYVPGTGERFGVMRAVQLLLLCAVLSQPRICLRLIPISLLWFVGYSGVRILSGLWFSPELVTSWWPGMCDWFQFSFPWVWIIFNVLQFPKTRRAGLWAFACGCSLCAVFHILGIGVAAVDNSLEEVRTSIFGENANLAGATYAVAVIILIGLGMFKDTRPSHRLLIFPLIALVAFGLAKTGSRTSGLLVAMGTFVLLFQAESFSSRLRRYSSLMLIGAILAGVIWQVPVIMQRFGDINASNLKQQEGRARMAPVLWEMFLRSPIYGSGPAQYEFELTRRAMPYLIRDQRTIVAHNLALLLLVETGLIGFLIFSAGLWAALKAAWRARGGACGFLPLALLVPFLVEGMILGNPTSNHTFWFAIAYALAGAA
jgi:O-antigen ligase